MMQDIFAGGKVFSACNFYFASTFLTKIFLGLFGKTVEVAPPKKKKGTKTKNKKQKTKQNNLILLFSFIKYLPSDFIPDKSARIDVYNNKMHLKL